MLLYHQSYLLGSCARLKEVEDVSRLYTTVCSIFHGEFCWPRRTESVGTSPRVGYFPVERGKATTVIYWSHLRMEVQHLWLISSPLSRLSLPHLSKCDASHNGPPHTHFKRAVGGSSSCFSFAVMDSDRSHNPNDTESLISTGLADCRHAHVKLTQSRVTRKITQ